MNEIYKRFIYMSIQRSQNDKRRSKSNSEWLDEMISIINRMKNKL